MQCSDRSGDIGSSGISDKITIKAGALSPAFLLSQIKCGYVIKAVIVIAAAVYRQLLFVQPQLFAVYSDHQFLALEPGAAGTAGQLIPFRSRSAAVVSDAAELMREQLIALRLVVYCV